MKLRPFGRQTPAAPSGREKPAPIEPAPIMPAPPRAPAGPPPRVWSLLLPPGFSNDRR